MNYLIFSPYSTDCTNAAQLLDYSIAKLNESDDNMVFYVYLDSSFATLNDLNIYHSKVRACEIVFDNYITRRLYNNPRIKYIPLSVPCRELSNFTPSYSSLEEIKHITFNGINVGYGVVASFVSFERNISPVFNEVTRDFFDKYLKATALVAYSLNEFCGNNVIDRIVTFNGRYATQRVAVEVAKSRDIQYSTLEQVGLNIYKEVKGVEFVNCMPHSINNATIVCNTIWEKATEEQRKFAESFFIKRAQGIRAGDKVYVGHQVKGLLPENWDPKKKNIVFFSSSEDEFFSIGPEWEQKRLFKDQNEAIKVLSNLCKEDENIHIYLRIHPNLIGLPYSYAKFEEAYTLSNVTVIPATSPISTYALIQESDVCLTMGSTAGVEASYWGKPSILLGGSLYYYLDCVYVPKDIDELNSMLHSNLVSKPKENVLKYGAFICGINRGVPPQYINYIPITVRFRGHELDIPACMKILGSRYLYVFSKVLFRVFGILKKRKFDNYIVPILKSSQNN